MIALLAALICCAFVGGLRDVPAWSVAGRASLVEVGRAPVGDRSCSLRLVDEEGRALEAAVVRAFSVASGGEVQFAGEQRSDAEGKLELGGLVEGETWFLAYGEARARASTRVLLGERRCDLVLSLRPALALAVRVVDDAGKAVADADVSVVGPDPLPHQATSSSEGEALFDRLGPAPWQVSAVAPGYEPVQRTGIHPGPDPLELRLERLGGFRVSVVDENDEPVPFAEVLVSGPGIWPARTTTTDGEGHALITGLPGGVYDLKARLDDRVSATETSIPLSRGATVERTLRLGDGLYLNVRVGEGPKKEGVPTPPVAGARVIVVERGLSAFPIDATTNSQGEVVVGPLGDEPFASVMVHAEGFVPRTVSTLDAVDGRLEIDLSRGGVVFGRVRDERGFPIDGATIEIFGTDLDGMPVHDLGDRSGASHSELGLGAPLPLIPRGELGVMPGPIPDIPRAGAAIPQGAASTSEPWVTRTDGTYRAGSVTPGRLQVLARHPDFIEGLSDVFELRPSGEKEVDLVLRRGGRLSGRVREEDGLPVAGARIEIVSVVGTFSLVTHAADDGTFAVAAVPDEVVLSVERLEAPGEPALRLELSVPPGGERELDIVLPRARERTSFRVVDDRGYPLSRVELRVASLDPAVALRRTFFTDDDGMATVPGAKGLPLRVVAERPGQAPLAEEIADAGAEHQLVMQRALVARGRVTAREGRDKLEGAELSFYTATGATHTRSDANGEYEVPDLARGRVRIVARHPEHARADRVIWLDGDPQRPIELEPIDLVPSGEVFGQVVDELGEPVPGARVGHGSVPTFLPVGRPPPGFASTDGDGMFRLPGLPEGLVSLEAYSPELGRAQIDGVEIRAGRTTDRVTIVIEGPRRDARKLTSAGSVAMTLAERGASLVILDVPEGGEAETAGVEPDDALVSINGKATQRIEQARSLLGGPIGDDVVLELSRELPDGKRERVRLRVRREAVRR